MAVLRAPKTSDISKSACGVLPRDVTPIPVFPVSAPAAAPFDTKLTRLWLKQSGTGWKASGVQCEDVWKALKAGSEGASV